MRTTVIAAFVALTAAVAAFGQTSTVYLQNQESTSFYYIVDPKELEGLTPGSPQLATRVAGFFAEKSAAPTLATLKPGAEAKLAGLADGAHLLVGFFSVDDQDDFPVRVIALQADSRIGERFYALFASPAQLSVPRGVGRLVQFARSVPDKAAAAAAATPGAAAGTTTATAAPAQGTASPASKPASPAADATTAAAAASDVTVAAAAPRAPRPALRTVAAFSAAYAPESFTREKRGDFSVLPISESRAWSLTGTRLASLSAGSDSEGLRIRLSAPGGFSESVSYFFYVFTSRENGSPNGVTLELSPRASGPRGACLLWKIAAPEPGVIGTVTTTDTAVEVSLSADEVERDVLGTGTGSVSVDLTAAWYDRALGTWEEFYYTTFTSDEVPVIR
jgi:hypothetical protein